MAIQNIPISEARNQMTSLPEILTAESGAVAITRRGKPVLAIMPWELYESIIETLEIEHDKITVLVVATGIRKEGDKKDIYSLARKLLRLHLLDDPDG